MNGPCPVDGRGRQARSRTHEVVIGQGGISRLRETMALSDVLAKIGRVPPGGLPRGRARRGTTSGSSRYFVAGSVRRRGSSAVATELISTAARRFQGTGPSGVAITKLTDEFAPRRTTPERVKATPGCRRMAHQRSLRVAGLSHRAWSQCRRPGSQGAKRDRAGASDDPLLRACPGSTVSPTSCAKRLAQMSKSIAKAESKWRHRL